MQDAQSRQDFAIYMLGLMEHHANERAGLSKALIKAREENEALRSYLKDCVELLPPTGDPDNDLLMHRIKAVTNKK